MGRTIKELFVMAMILLFSAVILTMAGCASTGGAPNPQDCQQARLYLKNINLQIQALNQVPDLQRDKQWREAIAWYRVARNGAEIAINTNCPPEVK
jgi:hypothetical protein